MAGELHKKLQREAVLWLVNQGCYLFGEEVGFQGEILDVAGIKKNGCTYRVEVKASKQDLDKGRQEFRLGSFDYEYVCVPSELLATFKTSQWNGWGVLVYYPTAYGGNIESAISAKRRVSEIRFDQLIDLMFCIGGKACREFYFDNFRQTKEL